MKNQNLIDDFIEIRQCIYKDEKYSVRDNGAVLRDEREGRRKRKDDGVWTFGKKNDRNGYMYLGSHRIHIIVASAFYGKKDSMKFVVDHIDTNRSNNRKENLRWLTRLENALMNPFTLKKIEYYCDGDITKFIKDPSCLRNAIDKNPDVAWMRTVSSEEAKNAYENVHRWTLKQNVLKNQNNLTGIIMQNEDIVIEKNKSEKTKEVESAKSWIFEKPKYSYQIDEIQKQFIKATYPETALQMNWRTPTKFPCCPIKWVNNPLKEYLDSLKKSAVFSENRYGYHTVIEAALIEDDKAIIVWTHNEEPDPIKPYALAKIYFSGGQFLHENVGSFFQEIGAEKYFTLEKGEDWNGGEVLDDNC